MTLLFTQYTLKSRQKQGKQTPKTQQILHFKAVNHGYPYSSLSKHHTAFPFLLRGGRDTVLYTIAKGQSKISRKMFKQKEAPCLQRPSESSQRLATSLRTFLGLPGLAWSRGPSPTLRRSSLRLRLCTLSDFGFNVESPPPLAME